MDKLPDSLLLQILSRLDDSADVARCRVASKAFNAVFPDLRSIHLKCTLKWQINSSSNVSSSSSSQRIKPFKTVFLDLISKLKAVESVRISFVGIRANLDLDCIDLTDGDFAEEWLPRVSKSLKTLSISGPAGYDYYRNCKQHPSHILPLISAYCQNLVTLELRSAWLSVDNLNPMPMLTSLSLSFALLQDDEDLDEFNECFPNLQALKLIDVLGFEDPEIHLLNLKTCDWAVYMMPHSITLITPNLTTLRVESFLPLWLHVEAPMLSHFHLSLNLAAIEHTGALTVGKFQNLKKFWLESSTIGSILSEFQMTKTVETLVLHSIKDPPCDPVDLKLTLQKVFTVFPNVSSLRIDSGTWLMLESCLNPEDWDMLDGRKGLKAIRVYLTLVDPSLTF